MPIFAYRAASLGNDPLEGRLEALSKEAAAVELQRRGLVPIRIEAASVPEIPAKRAPRRQSAGDAELAHFLRNLATLTDAGMPVDQALGSIADSSAKGGRRKRPIKALAANLRDGIRKGLGIADALNASGYAMPSYVSGMVRAGEVSGALPEVLAELAGFMERSLATTSQIRSALIYPILLLALSFGSIILFLTVILPQFAPLFASDLDRIPAITRFFLDLSHGFQQYGWLAALALLALLIGLRTAGQSRKIAVRFDRLVLRLPIIGELVRQAETARFARTLGVLLRNGVQLLPALGTVQETIGNSAIRQAVASMRESLRAGNGLATPMASAGIFPAIAEELTAVGERAGKLDQMLVKLADILDASVAETTKRLLTLLVPLLTLGSAGIIAVVVGSIFTALFSVYDLTF